MLTINEFIDIQDGEGQPPPPNNSTLADCRHLVIGQIVNVSWAKSCGCGGLKARNMKDNNRKNKEYIMWLKMLR